MTADEFAQRAATRLPSAHRDYFDGAAADEHTLAANRSDWAALRLWPRVLRPLIQADTHTRIGPHAVAHPIWLAPVAYQRLAHPEGERATAMAAAAQGAGMVLSCQSSVEVETVARAFADEPAAGPLWFQLHAQPDPGRTRALAQRA
ncbi:MAG: alpha-hydroxy-acid oxidizing protein, partial [Burkholderiales bacterium]|nr:alpha-hydroxy-acid oxidizing protein [Burkholderiales bacterium]